MRKPLSLAAAVAVALAAAAVMPRAHVVCDGFLPQNDMKIPVGDVRAAGIDEAQFNAVLDKVQEVYGPIIKEKGGVLDIQRKWSDPTVNASAIQRGKTWTINMYGGLARHAAVSGDGFALVACHELGHHIGGFPKIGARWATNEGGSDYYATLKCLRKILPATVPEPVDPLAKQGCEALYKESGAQASCLRGTMAGVSVSALLAELGKQPKPKLDAPDQTVVDRTDDSHPDAQCRLDTYFQGALCVKGVGEDVTNGSPAAGSCTKSQGFTAGLRPRCWYKPANAEAESETVASRLDLTSPKALQEKLEAMRAALSGRGI